MTGRDPAAVRFFAMQFVRLVGALMVLAGVLVLSGNVAWLKSVPPIAGYAFAAIGLLAYFAVPKLLARKWRSPR